MIFKGVFHFGNNQCAFFAHCINRNPTVSIFATVEKEGVAIEKKYIRYMLCGIIGILILQSTQCACSTYKHYNSDSTVEQLEGKHQQAGSQLDAAGGELNSAGAAAGRADELIDLSQKRAEENSGSIKECQQLVGDCQAILADSQRIIREAEEAARQ